MTSISCNRPASAGGLCLNEDGYTFFSSFPLEKMNVGGLECHAEHYASGQAERVIFCATFMRSLVDSDVVEPFWAGATLDGDGKVWFRGKPVDAALGKIIRNLLTLRKAGIDPYRVWLDKVRACGREAWLSDRLNDGHHTDDPDCVMHDRLWREHPEYRLGEFAPFDFAHEEVRRNKLALIEELLERYDMDGLELDFTRFPFFFNTPQPELLTELMVEARKRVDAAAARRGHPVRLGVRILSRPRIVRRLGFDLAAWREARVADVVTVTNFWPCTDSDMPMEEWRELLGDEVELDAGLEIFVKASKDARQFLETPETCAGFASQYLHRGADRIYLFNHFFGYCGMNARAFENIDLDYSFTYDEPNMKRVLLECGRKETAYRQPRRHVVSYATFDEAPSPLPMPVDGSWRELRLNVGGGTAGREAFVVCGFEQAPPESLAVQVNGRPCAVLADSFDRPCGVDAEMARLCRLPEGALQDGFNTISFRLPDGTPNRLLWCEIFLP